MPSTVAAANPASNPVPSAVDVLLAEAYAHFEQGLCYDECVEAGTDRMKAQEQALEMYELGLALVAEANNLPHADRSPLHQGTMDTKGRVDERVRELREAGRRASTTSTRRNLHTQLVASAEQRGNEEAELVYWLPDGVQLVVIEGDSTAAPSPPSSLAIFRLGEKEGKLADAGRPDAFIQVGPWAYPLMLGQTNVLNNQMGVYVVPNPTSDHPDMFVGIILPRGLEPRLEAEFNTVLQRYATVKLSEIVEHMSQEQRQRTSERISQFLVRSGETLAEGVQWAANWTGAYVADRGHRYRASMRGREGAPANINPAIRNGVYVLHRGSKAVGRVTRYLLDRIGDVGIAVGKQLISGVGGESKSGRLVHSTATVIGGGITGASTVWMSLEEASKTLFRNLATETVQTVQVKYGEDASETVHHALYAAGHTTLAGFQLWDFGPRAIAGRMARKAGIQIVHGFAPPTAPSSQNTHEVPALDASSEPDRVEPSRHALESSATNERSEKSDKSQS